MLTTGDIIFRIMLIMLGCIAIINEQKLARFERRVWKYIKAMCYRLTHKEEIK